MKSIDYLVEESCYHGTMIEHDSKTRKYIKTKQITIRKISKKDQINENKQTLQLLIKNQENQEKRLCRTYRTIVAKSVHNI